MEIDKYMTSNYTSPTRITRCNNVVVLGSMKYPERVRDLAEAYMRQGYKTIYVIHMPEQEKKTLIDHAFNLINWADIVAAVTKPDGSFGDGVLYELEYARRQRKTIELWTDNEKPNKEEK